MQLKKLTPVLYVEAIEPCLAFWNQLGFEKTMEMPHGDRLGFVILLKDGIEVMYQTRASVTSDVPALSDAPQGGTMLFIEVDDVEFVDKLFGGKNYVIPRRKTFYGSDEVIVREPGGNVIAFAQIGG